MPHIENKCDAWQLNAMKKSYNQYRSLQRNVFKCCRENSNNVAEKNQEHITGKGMAADKLMQTKIVLMQ